MKKITKEWIYLSLFILVASIIIGFMRGVYDLINGGNFFEFLTSFLSIILIWLGITLIFILYLLFKKLWNFICYILVLIVGKNIAVRLGIKK